jgi:hypothetical protein
VRHHRKADLEQGDAGAQWAAPARLLALTATQKATFVKHLETLARLQSELPHLEAVPGLWDASALSLKMMYLSTLSELDAWIRAAFNRSTHHRTQRVLLQREAGRAESDRHSAKLHWELFQRGTSKLRQLLKPRAHREGDLTMLCDPATGKVTQLPDDIKAIAGSYSKGLLGGQHGGPGAMQRLHADRPWTAVSLWGQTMLFT